MKKWSLLSLAAIFMSFNVFAQFTRIEDTLTTANKISLQTPGDFAQMNLTLPSEIEFGNLASDTTRSYFIIQKPFGYTTYEGVRIRTLNNAEMKSILQASPRALKKYNGAANLRVLGALLLMAGNVAVAGGDAVESRSTAIGLGLTVSSVPFLIWANGIRKKAILIYNED